MFDFDKEIRQTYPVFCGIDEAGRGPLAGDVYAAAVIFDDDTFIEGINDSKKLSAKKRDALYDEIIAKAKSYCIATASVEEIAELNILEATMLAMKRACDGLSCKCGIALVDGNKAPNLDCQVQTVIKGDATSASIAAASILAKVSRDRYMNEMAKLYPQYGFEKHAGYGTKAHREAIIEYGPCPIHRELFLRKILKND